MEQDCKKLCFQDEHYFAQPLPGDHHWISRLGSEGWEVLTIKIHVCDMFNL